MRSVTQFPNRLRFRFSIKTLLLVVTLICVALAWKLYYERQRNRTICSQFADNALLSKHWVKDQNDNNFSQFTTQWAKDLSSDSASVTSFLHTDGTLDDHKPCTAFEKQILAKWLAVTASYRSRETRD